MAEDVFAPVCGRLAGARARVCGGTPGEVMEEADRKEGGRRCRIEGGE